MGPLPVWFLPFKELARLRPQYAQRDHVIGASLNLEVTERLAHVRSPYQTIEVFETRWFGKVLVIDDDLMLTERDEASYHEMLVHVPLNYRAAARPCRVLVVGGGDGGTAGQALLHRNVEAVHVIDIDEQVVAVSRKHFPHLAASFDDPRVRLEHADAAEAVRRAAASLRQPPAPSASDADAAAAAAAAAATAAEDRARVEPSKEQHLGALDVVLIDSTDFNQAESLFTPAFYRNVRRLLADRAGILVLNLTSLSWNLEGAVYAVHKLRRIFKHVRVYQVAQTTYLSGHYGYAFCSDYVDPLAAAESSSSDESGGHRVDDPGDAGGGKQGQQGKADETGDKSNRGTSSGSSRGSSSRGSSSAVDFGSWRARNIPTHYYTPEVHAAAFVLPAFVDRALSNTLSSTP